MEIVDNKTASAIVEVIDGGPLKITGQIILKDQKKAIEVSPEEVFLCRCGRSCNKPYCDESHKN
jgi:CDGSH iron-sulfur domain-containing protein 3